MTKKKKIKRRSLRSRMTEINIFIGLLVFLLCGLLFVMSVSFLIRKYVNYDLDFFLMQTSDNLQKRLMYIEDTINEIRSNQSMADFMDSKVKKKEVEESFFQTVNLNDSQNRGGQGNPVVEKIYLFRKDGEFISSFYYMLTAQEEVANNYIAKHIWEAYKKSRIGSKKFSTYYYKEKETLFVACPVMNQNMDEQGCMIYGINMNTLHRIMDETKMYQNVFWHLYTEEGQTIEFESNNMDILDKVKILKDSGTPVVEKIEKQNYRVFTKNLCLNLNVRIGILEDHAVKLLYDTLDIYIYGIIGVFLAGIIGFGIFTYKMTKPIEEVNDKLKLVEAGDFKAKLPDYNSKEFYEISQGFNRMTTTINHLVNEVHEKQILEKEMELKFLQSQMNPHFMFNVLNALAFQAKIDGNDELNRLISTFSKLIQAKIYRSDSEKVQICQEMEYVKYYLEIQKFRFGDKISYHMDIQKDVLKCYIPKLCIQLVVENAIVHGLEPKVGNGTVNMKVFRKDNYILIEIIDDGVGFDSDGEISLPINKQEEDISHNHIGLNNADSILKLLYGKDYGITIFSKRNQGTAVKLKVPIDC